MTTPMPGAAQFREHVNTTFQLDHAAGPVPLRLDEVTGERAGGPFVFFSIFFHGPSDRLLPQGTYTLDHDRLGSFSLFLVPVVGSNHERIVYEASFSQMVERRA
jgi:hypothetical protein